MITLSDHCPKCGGFLRDNTEALTSGHRSRQALRKARETILETWRARYRGVDGKVSPAIDSVLRQLARVEAISDRAIQWSERTAEPITSARHTSLHDRVLACADKIARLQLMLAQLAPEPAAPPLTVTFGNRYRGIYGAAGGELETERKPARPAVIVDSIANVERASVQAPLDVAASADAVRHADTDAALEAPRVLRVIEAETEDEAPAVETNAAEQRAAERRRAEAACQAPLLY